MSHFSKVNVPLLVTTEMGAVKGELLGVNRRELDRATVIMSTVEGGVTQAQGAAQLTAKTVPGSLQAFWKPVCEPDHPSPGGAIAQT